MDDFDFGGSDAQSIETLLGKARDLIAAGDYNNAKPLVNQILKQDGNNVKALWMYANLTQGDNPQKAVEALKRLIQVDPSHAKARALLDKLDDDDPFPVSSSRGNTGSFQGQPVINVHVNNTANAQAAGGQPMMMLQGKRVNQTAFIIGIIASFFGFFGIAHILNGKVGKGILWVILGFIWDVILLALSATVVLSCVGLGIHIYLMYSVAKQGAEYDTISTIPMGQMNIGR